MLASLLLILGFVFLIKGAQIFVDGASALARRLAMSELTIGLTIVAFGTALPELVVMMVANLDRASDLGLSTVVGSTLGNILLITGVVTVIRPLRINPTLERFHLPLATATCLALVILANNFFIDSNTTISVLDGLVLMGGFIGFIYMTLGTAHKNQRIVKTLPPPPTLNLFQVILYIVIGIIALTAGGQWVIGSALTLTRTLGLSETFIGLTIIALGTIIPELTTSLVAAIRHHGDLALGNIFGSIIFNLGFVIGINAIIRPITYATSFNINLIILMSAVLLLTYFLYTGKKQRYLERWEGIALICGYLVYIAAAAWQG